MYTSSDSKKMRRTREKIRKAFLTLYAEKSLTQINIKLLTEAAGINRGTFYLHYFDLDDLVTSIENEQLEAIANYTMNFRFINFLKGDTLIQFFVPVLRYIASNSQLFKILLSSHSRPRFRESLHIWMRHNLMRRFQSVILTANDKDRTKKELIIEYIVSANFGIIIHWIQSDTHLSPEELTDLISHISLKGPFQIIQD